MIYMVESFSIVDEQRQMVFCTYICTHIYFYVKNIYILFFRFFPIIRHYREFPGGPVAKTLYSQCRGPGFNPWSGNWIPHVTTKTKSSQINKNKYIFKKDKTLHIVPCAIQ